MTFGFSTTGFTKKTQPDIQKSIEDRQRAAFGDSVDVAVTTPLGQLNGVLSSEIAECWELLEEGAAHGFDPDAASDYLLTVLCSLTGTSRRGALASVSRRQRFTLPAGGTLNTGFLVARNLRPDVVFEYAGAPITNSGGAPADYEVEVTCTSTGPVSAPLGTLTVRVTGGGPTATTNLEDAIAGRDVDDDIILRQRREDQLALRGGSTTAAIKADLLDVENTPELATMRSVEVIENTADVTVDGMPPHSVEAIIDDGDIPSIDDDVIAQIIWDSKAGGIQTTGSSSGTAQDSNGDDQTVFFSRATIRPVYIDLALTKTDGYPVDGDTLVKEAIVKLGAEYGIADIVIALSLRSAPLAVSEGGIAGVIDVPTFELGFSASPSGTSNLTPGSRARATFSTANITIL